MKGSLMLVMYSASSSLNFTLSPRIASGHCEPVYSSEIQVKSLAGTGLVDSATYLFNGKCSNCRAWKGGSINVTNTAQKCTYGIGPKGGINSDDFNAPLDYHQAYGSFTIDMIHATGLGGIPEIGNASIATTAGEFKSGKSDAKALMHAIFMISSFVGLFPLGILLLRVGKSVRWHLINQAVAFALSFLGTVMGIIASTSYNRSKSFSDPHQIVGLLAFVLVIVQYTLGYLHHRAFKKTKQTTKMASIHVWLGRVVIVLGTTITFTGFPFALHPKTDAILAVIFVVMLVVFCGSFFAKMIPKKRISQSSSASSNMAGHKMQPWHSAGSQAAYGPGSTGGGNDDIALRDAHFDAGHHGSQPGADGLGPVHSTRGFV